MQNNWKNLGFKERAQYITALVLIGSGILIAFVSFFMTSNISDGVLIYIAQAFVAGGSIFGVSIYFKSKLGEFKSETLSLLVNEIMNKINGTKEDSKEE